MMDEGRGTMDEGGGKMDEGRGAMEDGRWEAGRRKGLEDRKLRS
jgi:hypothetical protein